MDGRVNRVANLVEKPIFAVSRILHATGQGVTIIMVLLTVTDVFLRYVFNKPIVGSYELTEFMMVILVFASLGYTLTMKGHVNVDLVISRLPERVQAIIESITSLLALGLFSLATWRNVLHTATTWRRHDVSHELFIPISPFVLFVAFGVAILSLVLFVNFLHALARALQK